jgi:hypothetical protein
MLLSSYLPPGALAVSFDCFLHPCFSPTVSVACLAFCVAFYIQKQAFDACAALGKLLLFVY